MYKVCIQCYTYNHALFIEDALNGFVIQETNFPFVATIVDDASTDDTPQVVTRFLERNFDTENTSVSYREEMEYGTVLFARHRTNLNCFFAVLFLKENHYSKKKGKLPYISRWWDDSEYVAPCEGDDYWTDPMKLQTQVDYLDEHKEYSLCCHRYRIYNQNSNSWQDDYVHALFDKHPNGFSFTRSDNLRTWITKTMTLVYRREWFVVEEFLKYQFFCDEHVNYHLLSRGPGYCHPFVGAVYRRTDTGVFAPLPEKTKTTRGVLIRSELLTNNLEDIALRDNVYGRLKKYLYKYGSLSCMKAPISICLRSFLMTNGLKASLRSAKKLLGTYVKGLFNRHYAK